MPQTLRHKLPYIAASQSQKHITYNQAIETLDLISNTTVKTIIDQKPISPQNGDIYLVGNTPENEWVGHAATVACFKDNHWKYTSPLTGWTIWVEDLETALTWTGSEWREQNNLDFTTQAIAKLGINTQPDSINRLSINSEASLFNHDGSSHRVKINKNSQNDTASLIFQTGFSGRAEFGLTGQDDLTLRQSDNGSEWSDILSWPKGSGLTRFHGLSLENLPIAQPDFVGTLAFVSEGLALPQFVYCDGTQWLRVRDGSPVIQFSTLSPTAAGSHASLSNNNQDIANSQSGSWTSALGEKGHTSGRVYFEVEIIAFTTGTSSLAGIANDETPATALNSHPGGFQKSAAIRQDKIFANGFTIDLNSPSYTTTIGDRIMIAVDIDQGRLWFGRNGTWFSGSPDVSSQGAHNVSFATGMTIFPALGSAGPSDVSRLHTGEPNFVYSIPEGFSAWR